MSIDSINCSSCEQPLPDPTVILLKSCSCQNVSCNYRGITTTELLTEFEFHIGVAFTIKIEAQRNGEPAPDSVGKTSVLDSHPIGLVALESNSAAPSYFGVIRSIRSH